jgi:hypothetical protein
VHRSQVGRSIETVTWEGVKGKVARAYDKGVEAATHAPGERIRLEDQRRLPRGARVGAEQFSPGFARSMFQRRFDPLQKATKGVTVTTAAGAVRKVAEAVDAGEITPASGLKVIGYLLADREGVHLGSRMTRYRHRKCANELGLVLADGVLDEVEVPLHDLVDEVMEAEWSG